MTTLADSLHKLPWAGRVEVGENQLRLFARDLAMAKRELPKLVAVSGLTLLRYELAMPSLEDVFVRLVERER